MRFGTDEQKKRFLPKIQAGEMLIAIGYSEPEAGTDLASLKTRAVRDGSEWVINGQKTFTSLADHSDYVWLAARTNPTAAKHRGISMFLVPLDAPGVKITPIWTMGGVRTNATYYEDVRVPLDNLVGGENQGWSLITNQLNHERVALFNYGPMSETFADVLRWAKETQHPGGRPRDRPALGAGEPRALPGQARGAEGDELEAGLGHHAGRAPSGAGVGDQGVRERVQRRGLPPADGGARRGGRDPRRLARARCCAAASSAPTARS